MLPRQKWTRQNVTRQIVTRQNVAEPVGVLLSSSDFNTHIYYISVSGVNAFDK